MRKFIKSQKAITLIALVITVIIMLILAAIGIGAITGGTNLFAETEKAGEKYNEMSKNEKETVEKLVDLFSAGPIGIKYIVDGVETEILNTATKNNVIVKFTNNSADNSLTLKYQIGATNEEGWLVYQNEGIEMTTNGTVYARLFDNAGQSKGEATAIVDNIDKAYPLDFNMDSVTATSNSITVSGSTTDSGSEGLAVGYAVIRGYQYKLMDNSGVTVVDWTTETLETSYTFSSLTAETEYRVSMRAIDKAGNMTEATNKNYSITTEKATLASMAKVGDYVNYDAGTWTETDFTKIANSQETQP